MQGNVNVILGRRTFVISAFIDGPSGETDILKTPTSEAVNGRVLGGKSRSTQPWSVLPGHLRAEEKSTGMEAA